MSLGQQAVGMNQEDFAVRHAASETFAHLQQQTRLAGLPLLFRLPAHQPEGCFFIFSSGPSANDSQQAVPPSRIVPAGANNGVWKSSTFQPAERLGQLLKRAVSPELVVGAFHAVQIDLQMKELRVRSPAPQKKTVGQHHHMGDEDATRHSLILSSVHATGRSGRPMPLRSRQVFQLPDHPTDRAFPTRRSVDSCSFRPRLQRQARHRFSRCSLLMMASLRLYPQSASTRTLV